MALPQIAAMTALSVVGYHLLKSPTTDLLEESHYGCNHKYCPPTYQIQVDRAQNTLMRDDRSATMESVSSQLEAAYRLNEHTYAQEALKSPGVALVAHAVA